MNRPEGTVVATGPGTATVSVEAAVACARCAAGRGCGAGLLQRGKAKVLEVSVAEGLELDVGDRVRLDLAPDRLLRAAWLAYGLPLLSMVVATALAALVLAPGSDLAMVAFGGLGLAAGVLAGRRKLGGSGCARHLTPVARERIPARTDSGAAPPGQVRRRVHGRADNTAAES